jgi:hypothetical protein
MAKQDPKTTIEFLLGQIANDVATIKERQETIDHKIDANNTALEHKIDVASESLEKKITKVQIEVDEIREANAFNKGFIAAIAAVGASLGVGISYIFKYIFNGLPN